MISVFNLVKLNALLKDFYTITNIRITVFDDTFHELAAYPKQIAPFCRLIRTDRRAAAECARCDSHACKRASRQHSPYTYRCHAGLTESIVPLCLGNIVIGYLLFGHVFSYPTHEDGWKIIEELCSSYHMNKNTLKEACFALPVITEDYIAAASHIMQAVASLLCLEHMAVMKQQELPVRIDEYIMEHYTEKIDTKTLCEHFQIGKTRLYEIANQIYGTGIASHIRHLRIEKAKELLTLHPEMRISEIAGDCGFEDYNYFITIFKRLTGIPPKQYRQIAAKSFMP